MVKDGTQISQQAIRAAEVVRRLRDLVRKEESERRPCEVEQIVAEAVQMMGSNARRRGVALRTSIAVDLPAILVDRIQIQQVLLNLIANGLDAIEAIAPLDMPPGEPDEVIVEAFRRDDHRIEVRVHDTGIGLANTDPETIFEPFFSTKTQGLGMGLAISRLESVRISTPARHLSMAKALRKSCGEGIGTPALAARRRNIIRSPVSVSLSPDRLTHNAGL